MTDHPLDVVARAIDAPIPTDVGFPVAFWRYAAADARILQRCPDGVGVVALVGQQIGGLFFGKRITSSNAAQSAASPGVRWKASGMPRASLRQRTLQVKPPRERPKACS